MERGGEVVFWGSFGVLSRILYTEDAESLRHVGDDPMNAYNVSFVLSTTTTVLFCFLLFSRFTLSEVHALFSRRA